jgi:hypothetical protein
MKLQRHEYYIVGHVIAEFYYNVYRYTQHVYAIVCISV